MTKEIVQKDNAILRDVAPEVNVAHLPNPEMSQLINDLSESLANSKDGVAIAAPQIGVSLRVFLVAGKVVGENQSDKVFINPVITKRSKDVEVMGEGCLSVRGYYGDVIRSTRATVTAYDENGNQFELGASGLMAQIFQHEIDHLDGILYIDKAEEVRETTDE